MSFFFKTTCLVFNGKRPSNIKKFFVNYMLNLNYRLKHYNQSTNNSISTYYIFIFSIFL